MTDPTRPLRSGLILGDVMHCRLGPVRHRFRQRTLSVLLDFDELPDLDARLSTFSVDRPNLFAFHNRDHGPRDGSRVRLWVESAFARAGRPIDGGRLIAHCFLRTLGYVFDPLTVYWGYDRSGQLAGVLYEVKNTFGDQHCYLVPTAADRTPGTPIVQRADKRFHVSPFFDVSGGYRFRLDEPGDRLRILIRLTGPDGTDRMVATQTGVRRPLTDAALLRGLASHPLSTLAVTAGIHWQALKLWRKRLAYHPRPEPPSCPVSLGRDDAPPATARPAA